MTLKPIYYIHMLLFATVLGLTACGGSSSKEEKNTMPASSVEEKQESSSSASSSSSESKDSDAETKEDSGLSSECEAFLKGYESYMNKYIATIKKMKSNPADLSVMSDYTELASEASKWTNKGTDCVANAKYLERFNEIQQKITEAASDLGR